MRNSILFFYIVEKSFANNENRIYFSNAILIINVEGKIEYKK